MIIYLLSQIIILLIENNTLEHPKNKAWCGLLVLQTLETSKL